VGTSSVREIRDRLGLLSAVDRERRIFGAASHLYRLAPPLSDGELVALERRLGALPAEYRRFVQELGAHGAGPGHGLLPPSPPLMAGGSPGGGPAPDPTRPFLCHGPAAHGAPVPPGAHLLDGTIAIADDGCGMRALLVVRGPRAGEVWQWRDQAADRGTVEPDAPGLFAWYARWLDQSLVEWIEGAAPAIALDGPSDPAELEAIALGFELVEQGARRQPRLLRTLGYLHLRERRWGDAESTFIAAANASDEEPATRLLLDRARLAIVRGDPEHAITLARRGLELAGGWHATRDALHDVLERALAATSRADEALAVLEQRAADSLLARAAPSLALHHRLARERLARNDVGGAGAALECAAQMASILGEPRPLEARVAASFQPIIAELRRAGRALDAEALEARASLILGAN
jgi:hypothetical protein